MPYNHTVGVVAHQQRATQAQALAASINAEILHMDDGTHGCHGNHHRAWQWHTENTHTEWAVVLEDDALPVQDFRTQLTAALDAAPTDIISLYLGRQRPAPFQQRNKRATTKATNTGAHWITSPHMMHAVAAAIRTQLIPEFLQHPHHYTPPDELISTWARTNNRPIGYTWPSLVDHADGPTLVVHPDGRPRKAGRIAWQVGTRDTWNSETVQW